MPAYMSACMYVRIYVRMRTCACIHVRMHICAHVPHAYMCACVYVCMHTCMHGHMCACRYIHRSTCMHAYSHAITCMHAYLHTCMHACIHTYMHVCLLTCNHMQTCMYTHARPCKYVLPIHAHACIYRRRASHLHIEVYLHINLLYTRHTLAPSRAGGGPSSLARRDRSGRRAPVNRVSYSPGQGKSNINREAWRCNERVCASGGEFC